MQTYRREQVLGLAPDAAAAKAGQGQAIRARWPSLGHDEQAVWGECKGSGSTPYRCQAALTDTATRCSCPSRKVPCKHALGLLLLLADGEVPEARCPDWVTEWLGTRAAGQAKREARATRAAAGAGSDPQARQRRAAARESKVDAGIDELRRWLADLARSGLAAAAAQPWRWWEQLTRRMIDAQARGLANRVRRLAEIAAAGAQRPDWPERMLDEIGALHLMCEAWTRRDALPPATALALRSRIGFTQPAAEVTQSGRRITDTWAVLGQRQSDDGQLRSLQQWLYGEISGEVVTYLAFAVSGAALDPGLPAGARSLATVAVFPGSLPHRVLILERADGVTGLPLGPLPGAAGWRDALARVAEVLAVDPWADVQPVAVREVSVLPSDGQWLLRDRAGLVVPVVASADVRWRLFALSGGLPVDVAGEWDGFAFSPQAAAPAGQDGQLVA